MPIFSVKDKVIGLLGASLKAAQKKHFFRPNLTRQTAFVSIAS